MSLPGKPTKSSALSRRALLQLGMATGVVAVAQRARGEPSESARLPLDAGQPFPLEEATLEELQQRMASGAETASIPPLSTLESAPVTQLFGKTISKAPKKETANRTNSIKKMALGIQCVLKALANPAPALVRDTIIPREE